MRHVESTQRARGAAFLLVAAAIATGALVACHDFDSDFSNCLGSGRCADEASADGGSGGEDASVADAGNDAGDGGAFSSFGVCRPVPDAGLTACWENPTPQGNALTSVWVAPDGTAWIAGEGATVLEARPNGGGFRPHALPVDALLPDLDPSFSWKGICGFGTNDVYVAGSRGKVSHFDGGTWSPLDTPDGLSGNAIACAPGGGLWVAHGTDALYQRTGPGWTKQVPNATTTLEASSMWVSPSGDLWVVASDVFVLFNDQMVWQQVKSPGSGNPAVAVWGHGDRNVLVTGSIFGSVQRWTGPDFMGSNGGFVGESTSPADSLLALHGSETDEWAVGLNGDVVHHALSDAELPWTRAKVGTSRLSSVFEHTPSDVWAVGDEGHIQHFDGTAWTDLSAGTRSALTDVSGTDSANVWAAGVGVIRRTPDGWVDATPPQPGTAIWRGIHTFSPNDTWAVGTYGAIAHWDGGKWTSFTGSGVTTEDLNDVWGAAPDDVWAVGQDGTVLHWDGMQWKTTPSGTPEQLFRIDGSSASNVWIAGDAGVLLRGPLWTPVDVPAAIASATISGVSVSSDEIWIDTTAGLYRYDNGAGWTGPTVAGSNGLGVRATPGGGVFATGTQGALLSYDRASGSWRSLFVGNHSELRAIAALGDGSVFAVGEHGTILQLHP